MRAAVRVRSEPPPEAASGGPNQQATDLPAQRRLALRAEGTDDAEDRSLEGLQGHVAGEAVADDHIRLALEEHAPFLVAHEPEAAVGKQRGRLERQLVAF